MLSRFFKANFWPYSDVDVSDVAQQMRDYCQIGLDLVWQRQVIFVAALGLAAFYYEVRLAVMLLFLVFVSEAFDYWLFRRVLERETWSVKPVRRSLLFLFFSTVLSASIIASYSISIAIMQGPTTHFMSLFFLFAAALFAAMNNHQLLSAMVLRLVIYGATFLFIPIRDVVISGAPIQSELWAQLLTSIFVLFFILECSRIYLQLNNLKKIQLDELKSEHERSKIAFRAKTEFVSTMNHELRTPLTSIKGAVDMVNSGKLGELPEKAAHVLKLAQRNCDSLLSLINDILDLQSVEMNALQYDRRKIDLLKVVVDSIDDIESFAEKLDVEVVLIPTVQNISVHSDSKRLGQVFSNILSNAIKYSPAGSTVHVSMQSKGDRVSVLFSDEGVGLSQAEHERVFDMFTQVDSSDTRKIGGTGLGMNISKRIIEALGGSITYSANEMVGTTFIVEIPLICQK
jgi:signal transduction histidine kinase